MKIFILACLVLSSISSLAQDQVSWSSDYNEKDGAIEITAKLQDGWHLYSQFVSNDIGPIPTEFRFENNSDINYIGKVSEPEPVIEYDPNFEANLSYFSNKVTFTQNIELLNPTSTSVTVTYMVCNDEMCMPPTDQVIKIELK